MLLNSNSCGKYTNNYFKINSTSIQCLHIHLSQWPMKDTWSLTRATSLWRGLTIVIHRLNLPRILSVACREQMVIARWCPLSHLACKSIHTSTTQLLIQRSDQACCDASWCAVVLILSCWVSVETRLSDHFGGQNSSKGIKENLLVDHPCIVMLILVSSIWTVLSC